MVFQRTNSWRRTEDIHSLIVSVWDVNLGNHHCLTSHVQTKIMQGVKSDFKAIK